MEGAKRLVGRVLNKADVGTLIPAMDPVDAIALGGMVPGPKTDAGKVLIKAAVGTL